jgi:hypothetical protein
MQRKGMPNMTSRSDLTAPKSVHFALALNLLCLTIGPAVPALAADVPAVSEVDTFGAIDGEFTLKGLKGFYRWNVIQKWTQGETAVRADNTHGVVNGEFGVRAVYVANSNRNEIVFNDQITINGTSDEKGAIFYPPGQTASFSQNIMGNYTKYVLMNNAYHVVGKGPKFEIEVVTRDGYLTCADGTEVSFFAIYAEEISDDPYSTDGGLKDVKLLKPGTATSASLVGSYQDGRIVLNPEQNATIWSSRKLRLEDGTVLLPNEDDIYHLEVREGVPTFVGVTVQTESQ